MASISPEDFYEKFAFTGRPLVVTDEAKAWLAGTAFSADFFRKLYHDVLPSKHVGVVSDPCDYFPYSSGLPTMAHFVERLSKGGNGSFYVGWSNCGSSAVKLALRKLYRLPRFLSHPQLVAAHTDWVFMGTPGPGAPAHYDAIYDPSWQAQVVGTKEWHLAPPPECAHVCKAVSTTVYPGAVVVIDTHRWLHRTVIRGPNLSITVGSEFYRVGTEASDTYIVDEWDYADDGYNPLMV